eukprot:364731-Chlamydomonas_euryale.AAC.20
MDASHLQASLHTYMCPYIDALKPASRHGDKGVQVRLLHAVWLSMRSSMRTAACAGSGLRRALLPLSSWCNRCGSGLHAWLLSMHGKVACMARLIRRSRVLTPSAAGCSAEVLAARCRLIAA